MRHYRKGTGQVSALKKQALSQVIHFLAKINQRARQIIRDLLLVWYVARYIISPVKEQHYLSEACFVTFCWSSSVD